MRFLLALVLLAALPAFPADRDDCADALDRLRGEASEAADAGDTLRDADRGDRKDAWIDARNAIREVHSSLLNAASACGARLPAPKPAAKISQEKALEQIDKWAAEKKRTDRNYLQIESQLIKVIDRVVKDLPPEHWLPAIQIIYAAMSGSYL